MQEKVNLEFRTDIKQGVGTGHLFGQSEWGDLSLTTINTPRRHSCLCNRNILLKSESIYEMFKFFPSVGS